ncbi:MAG: 3-hydroxyacyl-CoA dehydrogenase NAD-binding domain-containing protein [Treponema sp.]|nr:3-hydroxyacyl-CoA dehydrogenase NAD-binding domain-containing protein [Treponema sp.]
MKVGIVGAGTMGTGIAQAFACVGGFSVELCDVDAQQAERGKAKVSAVLERLVSRQKICAEDAEKALAAITTGVINAVADCDLVIEAALEDINMKRELFALLDAICKKGAIFATNSSSFSVAKIGKSLSRPVVGMHFFNPVHVMRLVEVIAPPGVPDSIVKTIKEIAERLGKTPVVVKDQSGFVVNRLLIPFINEAIGILAENTASAADIDTAMRLGANHPMGPLELADLIGLDICLALLNDFHNRLGEEKYKAQDLLKEMVAAGTLGRKSGKGFYEYEKSA